MSLGYARMLEYAHSQALMSHGVCVVVTGQLLELTVSATLL